MRDLNQFPDDSHCPNCSSAQTTPFCPQCGQKRSLRLDGRAVGAQLWQQCSELDFDLPRTLRALLVQPGRVLAEYLHGRRNGIAGPARFFFILVTISVALTLALGLPLTPPIHSDRFSPQFADALQKMPEFVFTFRAYFSFIILLPLAWLARLLWRRSGIRFAEAYAVLLYAGGLSSLLQLLLESFAHWLLNWEVSLMLRALCIVASQYWLLHGLLRGNALADLARVLVLLLAQAPLAPLLVLPTYALLWSLGWV